MTIDPAYDLQMALFATLANDAGVATAIGRVHNFSATATTVQKTVFDRVPQPMPDGAYPFLGIGEMQILNAHDHDNSGVSDVTAMIHCYSRSYGRLEVHRVAGAVRDALRAPLAIANFTTVTQHYETTHNYTDPDGLTEHAVVEMHYIVSASN